MLITMMGAFAQAESESISHNVRWGIRQAMREGRATVQYKNLYGYGKDEGGNPYVIPEEAEVVRRIYKGFLQGQSIRQIKAGWMRRESPPERARSGPSPPLRIS